MFDQDKVDQTNRGQEGTDLQAADLSPRDQKLQEDLMTTNALPAHVEDLMMHLVSAPDDEVLYERIEALVNAGTVRAAGSHSDLLIDGYHIILTDPSQFQTIRTQLQTLEAREISIAGRLVESSLSVDQETAFLVTRLPEGMQAVSIVFGRDAGAQASAVAIEKYCAELEKQAQYGAFDSRAFDPTNWLYDSGSETISVLNVTMPETREPSAILTEIEAFKKQVL